MIGPRVTLLAIGVLAVFLVGLAGNWLKRRDQTEAPQSKAAQTLLPFSFRGVSFETKRSDLLSRIKVKCDRGGDTVRCYEENVEIGSVFARRIVYSFHKDKLSHIQLTFHTSRFDAALSAVIVKYGNPSRSTQVPITLLYGTPSLADRLEWSLPNVEIVMQLPDLDYREGTLIYQLPGTFAMQSEARARRAIDNAQKF